MSEVPSTFLDPFRRAYCFRVLLQLLIDVFGACRAFRFGQEIIVADSRSSRHTLVLLSLVVDPPRLPGLVIPVQLLLDFMSRVLVDR